jgi:acyl-CoA thioester hydrolase
MNNILKSFPYEAPIFRVSKDMCDQNGHMNVAYYLQAFDENSRDLFEELGFTKEYFQNGFSCFAIEDSLRYLREFLKDDDIISRFRIHDYNQKLIHIVGILLDKKGNLSAISETIVAHIDMRTRKTTRMPDNLIKKVEIIADHHTEYTIDEFELKLRIKKNNK